MEQCLSDQQFGTLLLSLDDIHTFASSRDSMIDCIEMVFGHLKNFHLKLSPQMYFFANSVFFLGQVLLADSICTNPEQAEKSKKMADTKTFQECPFFPWIGLLL